MLLWLNVLLNVDMVGTTFNNMFSILSMLISKIEVKKMENHNEKHPEESPHPRMRPHHMGIRHHCREVGTTKRVIVKGYMRPDKTSYYVVIPKEIREMFKLEGGEYFIMRAEPWANKINLKIAKFIDEEPQP